MVLLTPEERGELIDIMCKLAGIEHINTRRALTATLPDDLRDNIGFNDPVKITITSIVDMAISETWFQLADGRYPILIVIENAMNMVRGSQLESRLLKLANKLRSQLGQPLLVRWKPEPTTSSLAQFMQKLDELINLLPSLESDLEDISGSFNQHIYQPDCIRENNRLIRICNPVLTFSAYVIHSSDLPTKVIPLRIELMEALKSFHKQMEVVAKCTNMFCTTQGAKKDQPLEERRKIQEQLSVLIECGRLVLDEARALRNVLRQ